MISGATAMVKRPVGPVGPVSSRESGALQGGVLGVLPPLPIRQTRTLPQFGVARPLTESSPG